MRILSAHFQHPVYYRNSSNVAQKFKGDEWAIELRDGGVLMSHATGEQLLVLGNPVTFIVTETQPGPSVAKARRGRGSDAQASE